jgi:uncharacterized alkaline shock family protein YloU
MAVTGSPGPEEVLPCGRAVEPLWQQVLRGTPAPDEHQVRCPFCTAATSGFAALAEVTRAERADGAVTAPQTLRARVMAAVRAEAGRGRPLDVERTPVGRTELSRRAAIVVLRHAADTVTGVRTLRCRVLDGRPDEGRRALRVELEVAVPFGAAVPDLVEELRARVRAVAGRVLGLPVETVDVTVEDVYRP